MSGPGQQNQEHRQKREWDINQGLNQRLDEQHMHSLFDQDIRTAVDLNKEKAKADGYYNINRTSEEVFKINGVLDRTSRQQRWPLLI